MSNWKDIWSNRSSFSEDIGSPLSKLIKANGFDTGYGTITEDSWILYTNYLNDKFNIFGNKMSIFEIGCGSGAFLYPFYQLKLNVSGLDYSKKLVDLASEIMPKAIFTCSDANELNVEEKFDIVLSNSVFFYFESLDYAESVLEKMVQKSNNYIMILEVSDFDKKEEAIKIRKGYLSDEEYRVKYDGLNHLYYERSFFETFAKKHNLTIEIEQQNIKDYKNNAYRFNVFMRK